MMPRYTRRLGAVTLLAMFAVAFWLRGGSNDDEAALRPPAPIEVLPDSLEVVVDEAIEPLAEAAEAAIELVTQGYRNEGMASWYGPGLEGNSTANGERFDPRELTAAHPTLPFDTRVRVTDISSGRNVVVRINDRGPYAHGRIIDLSEAAARRIGLVRKGHARVRIEEVKR